MARSFNGSTDKVDVGAIAALCPTSGSFTYAGWVNPTAGNSYGQPFGSYNATGVGMFVNGSHTAAYVAGNAFYDPGTAVLSNGTWYHFASTYVISGGNTTGTGYVNGIQDGTGTTSHIPGAGHFYIGFDSGGASPFHGSVADVAVWDRLLSTAEIAALASGVRPWMFPNSLKGYWPVDGIQSPEPDLSGNAFNGMLTGTALASGPPIAMFTPRWPQFNPVAAAGFTAKQRRTLSLLGTRVGSRQMQLGA